MIVPLLTAKEVAKHFNCNHRVILRWRQEGIIPAEIARGNLVRFDLEKVREALREDVKKRSLW